LEAVQENWRQLKAIVADQALDIRALKAVLAKPARPRGEASDGGGIIAAIDGATTEFGPQALSAAIG
jgi:hypothetical protein